MASERIETLTGVIGTFVPSAGAGPSHEGPARWSPGSWQPVTFDHGNPIT